MLSDYSSYKKIIEFVAALLVIFMMVLGPVPFALAQEVPEEDPVEEVVEEVVEPLAEDPPTEETTVEEDTPEPQGGGDGSDGGDGGDGGDGTPGDGNPETGPAEGDDGGSTGAAGDGGDGGGADTGGDEENNTGEEETTIETGDAEAEGDIKNYVDLSILQTLAEEAGIDLPPLYLSYIYFDSELGKYVSSDPSKQEELDEYLLDGFLDPEEYLQIVTPEQDVTASTTNDAIVENEAEIEAETGENSASYNQNVSIDTGDAKAIANVLNVVNTNIFDSEGFFLFLDNLGADGVQGDLDFRDFDFFNPDNVQESSNARVDGSNPISAICPTCGGAGELTINIDQNAEITNDIVVRSGTGQNEGLYNSGDTTINTGDAYAAANAINLANTNIVDSNYLLLTFNNYGDYNNDIVFPSANEFLEMFETGGQTTPASVNIDNNSTAGVDNNTELVGETGENIAHETPDGGSITTGDATTANNTLNQINSNLFGGSSFSILVKVHGEWDGDVVGIPDGMTWKETPEGIELIYDSEGSSCDGTSACDSYDAIDVTTNSATQITNNISVVALTGENKIEGAGGDAEINTGDAYAAANTINVANTNVIGKNWMMAVINIFGDFNGDLTFGQSNLWVGAKANLPSADPEPGTPFTYEYTVMNTGDAPATNVCLTNRFDSRLVELQILNPTVDREIRQGEVEYCIGTVNAGEIREITRHARIADHLGYGTTYITNDIEVQGGGGDDPQEDNFEAVTIDVSIAPPKTYNNGTKVEYKPSPKLSISKVNASPFFVYASSSVNYRIIVKNTGAGSAYNSVLIDTLYDGDGNKVYEEYWNLEEIYAGEYIEIAYTTFFNEATEPGTYRNVARIEALGGYHTFKYGHDASTESVESTIKVVPNPYLEVQKEQVIEIVEESKEVTESIDEKIIEEDVVDEEHADEPIILAVAKEAEFAVVFGPYHGPLYYEHGNSENAQILSKLFDHPQFTTHPVHIGARGVFSGHPLFTQHPVYLKHSYFNEDNNSLTAFPWLEDLTAGIGFIKLLKMPFGDLSKADTESDDKENGRKTIALLAFGMFIMRRPVYRPIKKNQYNKAN